MKTDLDAILRENDLDGMLVVGSGMHNPPMVYLTGIAHLTGADLIWKTGEGGTLFHGPMERDEAARSGLRLRSYSLYPLGELLKEAEGDMTRAMALRYEKMFKECDLTQGRVVILGKSDAGYALDVFRLVHDLLPDLHLVGDVNNRVMQKAMATKDASEVERIRQVGRVTTEVVGRTAEFLSSQKVKDQILVTGNGETVTIGMVKRKINLWLAELGVENPEGTIFAIGRDAGVPHSSGTPGDVLRLGQTIVYDIFPCEAGGGYYYDMTRTWCLGYVPDDVQKLYDEVREVYDKIVGQLRVGELLRTYHEKVCDYFEAAGHPTIRTDPSTERGYVHSLGHGVGLYIHERPMSGITATAEDVLQTGSVFTIEPGLYYPDRNMGVRLEDTFCVTEHGNIEPLAEYPHDLLIPVKG